MSEDGNVVLEVQDDRWHVQFNNPGRRNAIDVPMREQLDSVLHAAVTDADCLGRAFAQAAKLRRRAPLALAASKRALADSTASLDTVLALEAEMQQELLATTDFAEGRRILRET